MFEEDDLKRQADPKVLGIIFEFLVEVIGEVFTQFILEFGMELGVESVKEAMKRKREPNPILSIIGLLILGSLIGLVSAFILPDRIISRAKVSGLGILVSPIITGFLLNLFGNWRRGQGKYTSYLATFWGGASFAFALTLIRWYLVGRF